jgi:hypothetical protein
MGGGREWGEMTTWYRTDRYSAKITPVEVVKETAQQVVYVWMDWGTSRESRAYKEGEFFPTFQEAKDWLIQRYEREVQYKLDAYSRAKQQFKVACELQEIP